MGKKILLFLAVMVILLAGGTIAYFQVKGNPKPVCQPQPVDNAKEEQTQISAPENRVSIDKTNQAKDYSQIGFDLMVGESLDFLKLGFSDLEVTKKLGEPEKKGKAEEWGADGAVHQSWFYPSQGIELDMVQDDHGAYAVHMITIKNPCPYRTQRGIGVGSTKDDLMAAYQNEINPEGSGEDSVVAGTVYGGLIFKIKNGSVSSIFIGAAAE